jgi:hypothetical protein
MEKTLKSFKEKIEIKAKIELIMSLIIGIKPENCSVVKTPDNKFSVQSNNMPLMPEFESLDELYAVTEERLVARLPLQSKNKSKIELSKDNFRLILSAGNHTIYDVTNGQGTCFYQNGNRYVGKIHHGNRDGKGTLYYSNGDRYDGMWEDNEPKGRGILISPASNLVRLFNSSSVMEVADSEFNFYSLDQKENMIKEKIAAKRLMFNLFFSNLSSFSEDTGSYAMSVIENSLAFVNYLKLKIEFPSNNLLEKIEETKKELNNPYLCNKAFEEVYLNYLEAVQFYKNPADYPNNRNIEYLKHIKEFGNLGLNPEKEELENKLAIKQHDLIDFNEKQLQKLMYIPGYNEALQYLQNPNCKVIKESGEKFIEVLKAPESSTNDFRIFLVNKDSSPENLEKIILAKPPSVHGVAYYFFSKEENGITKLGYGGKLNQGDYKAEAANVIKTGLNQDRAVSMFILNYEDIKNMKNDQELFDVINQHKESCAILFKNKDGQNITLQIGDLNKMYDKPSGSISFKSSDKMIENFDELSKNR